MATESAQAATMTVSELLGKLENSRLTANHYKLITTAMLGDMLEFFDYWIIGFILAFIVIPWKLSFGATAIVLLSAGVGSLMGAFFFGHLADRIGRERLEVRVDYRVERNVGEGALSSSLSEESSF